MHFAVIKFIMDIHNAHVQISNLDEGGASVKLMFPINTAKGNAFYQSLSQLN
jgi:hypothetical protein